MVSGRFGQIGAVMPSGDDRPAPLTMKPVGEWKRLAVDEWNQSARGRLETSCCPVPLPEVARVRRSKAGRAGIGGMEPVIHGGVPLVLAGRGEDVVEPACDEARHAV